MTAITEEIKDKLKNETESQVKQRHKLELRQQQQAAKKKLAALSGKKNKDKKRELQAELKEEEEKLLSDHVQQLAFWQTENSGSEEEGGQDQEDEEKEEVETDDGKERAKSKAQKRREKKEEEERQREKERERLIKEGGEDKGKKEMKLLLQKVSDRGLIVKEIAPDGDCLYAAVIDQRIVNAKGLDRDISGSNKVKILRDLVAEEVMEHKDEYIPFLGEEDGDIDHVVTERIREVGVWGGELEIRAISDALKVTVVVVEAERDDVVMGAFDDKIFLSYHRHAYTLGNHYNSLREK